MKTLKPKKYYYDLFRSKNNSELDDSQFESFASFIDEMLEEDMLREKHSDLFGYKHAIKTSAPLSEKPTEIAEKNLKLKTGMLTRTYILPIYFTDKYEFTDQIFVCKKNKDKFVELFKETMSLNNISIFDSVNEVSEMEHILNGITSRYMLDDIEFWIKNRVRKKTSTFNRSFRFCEKYDLGFIPSPKTIRKIKSELKQK